MLYLREGWKKEGRTFFPIISFPSYLSCLPSCLRHLWSFHASETSLGISYHFFLIYSGKHTPRGTYQAFPLISFRFIQCPCVRHLYNHPLTSTTSYLIPLVCRTLPLAAQEPAIKRTFAFCFRHKVAQMLSFDAHFDHIPGLPCQTAQQCWTLK